MEENYTKQEHDTILYMRLAEQRSKLFDRIRKVVKRCRKYQAENIALKWDRAALARGRERMFAEYGEHPTREFFREFEELKK